MGQIEWAMWANEQAIVSSFITILGGIIGVAGFFKGWEFGIYGIVAGLLVLVFEYPRGKRKKGRTVERTISGQIVWEGVICWDRCQRPLSRLLHCCGPIGRNYFVRFIILLILCVPCCFILATLLGGVCLFITSIIYLVAAFKGEQWVAEGLEDMPEDTTRELKSFRQPRKPPPRLHHVSEDQNRV